MERNRRWGLLAFVTVGLVVVALISLSSAAWATPALEHALQQTIPPVKTVNKTVVDPGEEVIYEVSFTNPGPEVWIDVVVTDKIDPLLFVDNVTYACQPGSCPPGTTVTGIGQVDGTVTVTFPTLPANTTVTIRIYCTVLPDAPGGEELENKCCFTVDGGEAWCTEVVIIFISEFVPEMGSLLLLGSGLAGLAGYAGMRWRARVR